jgi:glycosyltransferase involved in cell wall biosynthesis
MTITVVIPAYNSEQYIARAIDSVLAQTYKPDEIIIVDDGSGDNTSEIVRKYEPSVKLIQQENAGASVARNTGIEAATSEWIAFLDSDDEWLPEKLQLQVEHLKRNPNLQWTTANFIRCHCDKKQRLPDLIKKFALKAQAALNDKEYFDSFFSAYLAHGIGCTITMLIKKDLLIKAGLFAPRLLRYNDMDMWFKIAYYEKTIGYIKTPLSINHRATPLSITKKYKDSEFMCQLLDSHFALAEQHHCLNEFKKCAPLLLGWWIHLLIEDKRGSEARRLIKLYSELFNNYYKKTMFIKSLFPRTGLLYDKIKLRIKGLLQKNEIRIADYNCSRRIL